MIILLILFLIITVVAVFVTRVMTSLASLDAQDALGRLLVRARRLFFALGLIDLLLLVSVIVGVAGGTTATIVFAVLYLIALFWCVSKRTSLWEPILIAEQRFILQTVGGRMGADPKQIDDAYRQCWQQTYGQRTADFEGHYARLATVPEQVADLLDWEQSQFNELMQQTVKSGKLFSYKFRE